ncbi:MAG: HD domain-containing protein [bacterium]|nr:HD domain-containing protein [bacterium]
MDYTISLPKEVQQVLQILHQNEHQAYVVGGCLRDLIMQRTPKDWDVTTNALPDEIQKIFPKTLYLNTFGTVTVKIGKAEIEITTYRSEGGYTDHRHPDEVKFGVSLQEDVERRDFTINALAYDGEELVDKFAGILDIDKELIRAVGDANERFQEDALRMLRAIRFSSQLGFAIEAETWQAIVKNTELIKHVSQERIRDEIIKMVSTDDSYKAFWQLHTSGLLAIIIPELENCVGVEQNLHHIYTVFSHNLLAMQFCPSDDWQVRLASLFHDIGKPEVKEGSGRDATFYQHEHVSAKIARQIMRRMNFSNNDIKRIFHLVKHHMFYYNVGEITDAGVRRLLQRVGVEHLEDLMAVRIADRMGSGVYKEKPYKLIELEQRIEHVQKDPISTSMLAIDGNELMKKYGMKPGAKIGVVLHRLLDEVLEDPKRNTAEFLTSRAEALVDDFKEMSESDARAIMKEYRSALADLNAYKD